MAQGFKLVLRPSKPGEKDSEKKFYAVSKTNGTSSTLIPQHFDLTLFIST